MGANYAEIQELLQQRADIQKDNIYDQAVLEGVSTSFSQTEDIIENGQVNGVSAIDITIELCMYCMKTQVFKDGNKKASAIFPNHYWTHEGK